MKKITYLIYLAGAGIATMLLPSCKKLIQVPDNVPGQLVAARVFADSLTASSAVTGIYYTTFQAGPLATDMSLYPSLSADDITSPGTTNQDIFTNNILPGNAATASTTNATWTSIYGANVIYQANASIEGITASSGLTPTLKNQLIGECEVVRALSYFDLVNLYGPCPLALTSDYVTNSKLPRAPVDSVYAQIKRDLLDATNRLTAVYPSAGRARPNKFTALALLSRVYLYQQQWANALTTANSIINSGIYSLEPTLDNIFIINNKEAIWQGVVPGSYPYATNIASNGTFIPFSTTSTPTYVLTSYLVNAFEANDQRKVFWTKPQTVGGVTYYYPYKYKNVAGVQVGTRVEGDVLFRLAEQYLIAAEASAQSGDLAGAATNLNKIRNRAGLPNATTNTQAALLSAIARERQVELFTEQGHRWFDLKRTGTVNSVLSVEKPSLWPADGHGALYPISYTQLVLNPGWQQNPGY